MLLSLNPGHSPRQGESTTPDYGSEECAIAVARTAAHQYGVMSDSTLVLLFALMLITP